MSLFFFLNFFSPPSNFITPPLWVGGLRGHLIISGSCQKLKEEEGRGQKEENFFLLKKKICTYCVSVSRSRLGTSVRFSIMDKLLIRWEMGLFLSPPKHTCSHTHAHNPSLPIHPSLLFHPLPPSCLLPIQGASLSPLHPPTTPHSDWTATSEMPKYNLASSCGQNATFLFKLFD